LALYISIFPLELKIEYWINLWSSQVEFGSILYLIKLEPAITAVHCQPFVNAFLSGLQILQNIVKISGYLAPSCVHASSVLFCTHFYILVNYTPLILVLRSWGYDLFFLTQISAINIDNNETKLSNYN